MKESEITSNVVTKLLARYAAAEVLEPRHIQYRTKSHRGEPIDQASFL